MADNLHIDNKTRSNLAYGWSVSTNLLIGYIVYRFGDAKEILTLIIGFVAGSANTILALYFGGMLGNKPTPPGTAEVNFTATTDVTTNKDEGA